MFSPLWTIVQFQALFFSTVLASVTPITWKNCTETFKIPADCGVLPVPLDYTSPNSTEKLNLTMVKIKAAKQPFKGSILVNPGGPGSAGVDFMLEWAPLFLALTGGQFDVIAFDPRGTGLTLPVDCFQNPLDRLRYNTLSPPSLNASNAALGLSWAAQKTFAAACQKNASVTGELMGTAFVARDMMQIVDALDEDGMLRFFGQSYGTFLGATVASMFPDRIDKLVLDGVVNPHDYVNGWEYDPATVQELVLSQFFEQCIKAGFPACILATDGVTAENLTTRFHDLLEEVKYEPIVLGNNFTTEVVRFDEILNPISEALRIPIAYAEDITGYLHAIWERNLTAYNIHRLVVNPEKPLLPLYDSLYAIRCSDQISRAANLNDIRPQVKRFSQLSPLFGDQLAASHVPCAPWKMHAKGRYLGDYKAKTKNPALIIGSPWDVRTPIVSAHNVSQGLEGSVVLQHNGLGHCLMYSPGQCAIKAVQAYFINGTLPQPGTVCEQDFGVFEGRTIGESFGLGKSSTG